MYLIFALLEIDRASSLRRGFFWPRMANAEWGQCLYEVAWTFLLNHLLYTPRNILSEFSTYDKLDFYSVKFKLKLKVNFDSEFIKTLTPLWMASLKFFPSFLSQYLWHFDPQEVSVRFHTWNVLGPIFRRKIFIMLCRDSKLICMHSQSAQMDLN